MLSLPLMMVAARMGSTLFLAPPARTDPSSGRPPSMISLLIVFPPVDDPPAPAPAVKGQRGAYVVTPYYAGSSVVVLLHSGHCADLLIDPVDSIGFRHFLGSAAHFGQLVRLR